MKIESKNTFKMDYLNRVLTTSKHSVYLRIGEGCNNCCTYCAIPLIRGSYRSRNHFEILSEARNLVISPTKESIPFPIPFCWKRASVSQKQMCR